MRAGDRADCRCHVEDLPRARTSWAMDTRMGCDGIGGGGAVWRRGNAVVGV
jgi:hypothetical protein